MNYKKGHNRKRIIRKMYNSMRSVKDWSRMLHLSWKRDVIERDLFKRRNYDN